MKAPKKILLVDDSSTIRAMERILLSRTGAKMFEATNGEEAIEMALLHKPDLILLDFTMPVLDGLAALRSLRAHEITKAIPVIMVTTRCEMNDVEASFASGCSDYITKPIDSAELVKKVDVILGIAS